MNKEWRNCLLNKRKLFHSVFTVALLTFLLLHTSFSYIKMMNFFVSTFACYANNMRIEEDWVIVCSRSKQKSFSFFIWYFCSYANRANIFFTWVNISEEDLQLLTATSNFEVRGYHFKRVSFGGRRISTGWVSMWLWFYKFSISYF